MKRPVFEALSKLKDENSVSFHMPGHKGKNTLFNWGDYIPAIDTTETYDMDNLLEPRGVILESEKEAAKVFGAMNTFYAVNGSTGSIYIAIATITKPGDTVIVQRNCHKSVYNALILNRLNPVYVYPKYNDDYHVLTGVDPDEIEDLILDNPEVKAVIVTHTNYYGIASDLERIAEICHNYGKILMVDEAHGPHMKFDDRLPKSALECGADIVIHSTHKTLTGFTQTSMIHVGSERIDINKLKDRFQLYTTTSPSYLFTLSNETACAYMDGEGREKLHHNVTKCLEFIEELKKIDRVEVFEGDEFDKTIKSKDNTKILFKLEGVKGSRLRKELYERHNIRLEMSDYYYALIFATLMNEDEDYEKLLEAIKDLSKNLSYEEVKHIKVNMPDPKIIIRPADAYYSSKKIISLKDSLGEIVTSPIIPYPPGVPLLVPGEEITEEILDHIQFLKESDLNIVGLLGDDQDSLVVVD